MRIKRIFILLFINLLVFGKLTAQEYLTENGTAKFISKASLREFVGESQQLQGLIDLDKNLIDFYLDLNTLKTGIGLRDRHMRDNYLETKKFPFSEFTGSIENLPELEKGKSQNVTAKGKFKIHGVEREIEVPGMIRMIDAQKIELKASFNVLLSDYDIPIPKVMFYELAEEQIVEIEAILNKK
jgi:polyisoprenoid-binding protein YceI